MSWTASAGDADEGPEPRRLVVQASGNVVCAGGAVEVFGAGNRAVLRVERDGTFVEELLLLRMRRGVIAVVNRCPHMGRALDDGRLRAGVLRCRGHGRSYNLRTGRTAGNLSFGGPPRLTKAAAWTEGGQVFVDIEGIAPRTS